MPDKMSSKDTDSLISQKQLPMGLYFLKLGSWIPSSPDTYPPLWLSQLKDPEGKREQGSLPVQPPLCPPPPLSSAVTLATMKPSLPEAGLHSYPPGSHLPTRLPPSTPPPTSLCPPLLPPTGPGVCPCRAQWIHFRPLVCGPLSGVGPCWSLPAQTPGPRLSFPSPPTSWPSLFRPLLPSFPLPLFLKTPLFSGALPSAMSPAHYMLYFFYIFFIYF